jgi:hypothetical protein
VNEDELVVEAESDAQRRAPARGMKEVDVHSATPDLDVVHAHVEQILTCGLGWCVGTLAAAMEAGEIARHRRVQPGNAVRVGVATEVRVV